MGETVCQSADIGLIGLAVMGQNLVLNMDSCGFVVAVYNRTSEKVTRFLASEAKGSKVIGALSLPDFFSSLKRPRKVMFMVKAGEAVDALILECLPFLEPGDVIIDGGNSFYLDTERRVALLREKGIFFLGLGVSGGEEGARNGPSIMPGGSKEGWPLVEPIFQSIAAKAQEDALPCCEWMGQGGAGHFVKMVHNGIEYGDMQILAEVYAFLKHGLGLSGSDLQKVFEGWNDGFLRCFLLEITAQILRHEEKDGSLLLDHILDVARQKGTGQWTSSTALEHGIPVTVISEAVFARNLSAYKSERMSAARVFMPTGPSRVACSVEEGILLARDALWGAKLISYAQGFMLLQAGEKKFGWNLRLDAIARSWRAGCIIRAGVLLHEIAQAFMSDGALQNLLLAPWFQKQLQEAQEGWRHFVAKATLAKIALPAISSALTFFDGYATAHSGANLIQAQRDFFGAHTYERIEAPGVFVHTPWSQKMEGGQS